MAKPGVPCLRATGAASAKALLCVALGNKESWRTSSASLSPSHPRRYSL